MSENVSSIVIGQLIAVIREAFEGAGSGSYFTDHGADAGWIAGDRSRRKWAESWRVSEVDEAAWTRMRAELRSGYERLCRVVEAGATSSEDAIGGAVGAVAHVAYHLGAVRQKAVILTPPSAKPQAAD